MNGLRAFSSDILKHIFGSPLVSYNCSCFHKMLQWSVKISTTVSHINYYSLIFIRSFSLLSDSTSLSLFHTHNFHSLFSALLSKIPHSSLSDSLSLTRTSIDIMGGHRASMSEVVVIDLHLSMVLRWL